jgi:hypothetical protein
MRVGVQHREQLQAAGQAAEEAVEGEAGGVGSPDFDSASRSAGVISVRRSRAWALRMAA